MGNDLMQDYKGNASFSRWAALGLMLVGVGLVVAIIRWPQVQQAMLHAFDKCLETATWIFLGGKSPEMLDALRAKLKGLESSSTTTATITTKEET
jgi:hypothetical protein